jgi:hypothetical protein
MTRVRLQDIRILAMRLDVPEAKVKDAIHAFWPTAYQPTKWEQKREQIVANDR